jgi:hypothetical protein
MESHKYQKSAVPKSGWKQAIQRNGSSSISSNSCLVEEAMLVAVALVVLVEW